MNYYETGIDKTIHLCIFEYLKLLLFISYFCDYI